MKLFHSCMFFHSLYSCNNKCWPPLRDYLFQMTFILLEKPGSVVDTMRCDVMRCNSVCWQEAYIHLCNNLVFILGVWYAVIHSFTLTHRHNQIQRKFNIKDYKHSVSRPVSCWSISYCLTEICRGSCFSSLLSPSVPLWVIKVLMKQT